MPADIEQVADRAHRLVETGEAATARAVLREALASVEPDTAHANPSLATAAMLYARVLVTLGEPAMARQWAAYAHTASRRLYGAGNERTLQAASVLAGVLYRAGAYSRAAYLYRELITQLSAMDGPRSNRVLAAQADLATVLHARGDCAEARALLEQTWQAYRHQYGEDHPLGLKMLARLGVMERGCGLPERARERFALAEVLCRRHLPPGHRLTAQIGILSRTPADRRHVCNEPLALPGDREAMEYAGAWRPETDEAPLTRQAPTQQAPAQQAPTQQALAQQAPAQQAPTQQAPAQQAPAAPAAAPSPPTTPPATPLPPPAPPTASLPPAAPPAPLPSAADPLDDLDPRAGRAQRMRLAVAGVAVLIVTVVTIAAGGLIAQARTTVSTMDERPPGPAAPANTRPATTATTQPASTPTTTQPVGAPATTRPAATRPSAAPATTRAPAAAPPGPPTGVKLTDTRTAVTLSWVYPAGANGQVVLSAGRPGQPRRTFQTLPAGTSRFTVYGLAQDTNYCFGVGVAYSASVVKTAPAVCTARR